MFGVVNGVYICNNNRVDEINDRINNRNIPSSSLEPQYSIRPVGTKYGYMPILDQHKKISVPLDKYKSYSTKNTFNPGNVQAKAPWNGFSNNINVESILRNQIFALQKCEQSEFVPNSNSDLYKTTIDFKPQKQTHSLLFEQYDFKPFNPNVHNLGKNIYNNHTRFQLKDIN